jgi:hypothetical protein
MQKTKVKNCQRPEKTSHDDSMQCGNFIWSLSGKIKDISGKIYEVQLKLPGV